MAMRLYGKIDTLFEYLSLLDRLNDGDYNCRMEIEECVDAIRAELGLKDSAGQDDLSGISTRALADELARRENVKTIIVDPFDRKYELRLRLLLDDEEWGEWMDNIDGTALIMIAKDCEG